MNRRSVLKTVASLAAAPMLLRQEMSAGVPLRAAAAKTSWLTGLSIKAGIPLDRLKVTTWRPDTCGCELQYAWDRHSTEDNRVHVPVSAKCCALHACHVTPEAAYSAVLAQNQAKNRSAERPA